MTIILGIIILIIMLGVASGLVDIIYSYIPYTEYILRYGAIALAIYFIYKYQKVKKDNPENKYMSYFLITLLALGVFFFTNTPAEKIAKESNEIEVSNIDDYNDDYEDFTEDNSLEETESIDEEKIAEENKENIHTNNNEEAKDDTKQVVDNETYSNDDDNNQETLVNENIKVINLNNGSGTSSIGKMTLTIVPQIEATDEYLRNWFQDIKDIKSNYDVLIYQETINDPNPRGVYHNNKIMYKDVPFIPEIGGSYSVGDIAEETEMFFPNN